jgi:hypothetical protein
MSTPRILPRVALDLLLAGFLVLVGCQLPTKAGSTTSEPAGLTVVQGNGQIAQAGRLLTTPIVLRLIDADGRGVAKQQATLVVATGGGSVDPATAVSDSNGEMKVRWTLGQATQVQSLQAAAAGLVATVNATALFPTELILAQGASQTAKVSTALKNDVVMRVVGPGNVPMVGVTVSFRVTEGGGAISPQSAATNALGEVGAKWTLGAAAGQNTVVAGSGDLATVSVRATATP